MNGPGGYFVLVGSPASQWRAVAELLPGVALVAINPPAEVADEPGLSVLRGGRLPLKSRSMRGVVLGKGYAALEGWVGMRLESRCPASGSWVTGGFRSPALSSCWRPLKGSGSELRVGDARDGARY